MTKKKASWAAELFKLEKRFADDHARRGKAAHDIALQLGMDWLPISSLFSRDTSDWAFALQAVALIETALNVYIAQMLVVRDAPQAKNEKLRRCIENLPLLGGKASKVQFAKAVNFLPGPEAEDFINKLASIRNFYAHDLNNSHLGLYEVMTSKGNKTKKPEYRKAFKLRSDWETLEKNPPRLREEIIETLFSQLQVWHLFS